MFFLNWFKKGVFQKSLSVQERVNRAPQDATWPGERVLVWSYAERASLAEVLDRLRGEHAFGADELVLTDFGEGETEIVSEVAQGHRPAGDLPFERRDGVPVLHLSPAFVRSGLPLRKLLWLLPYDSIYLVTHESVDPRA